MTIWNFWLFDSKYIPSLVQYSTHTSFCPFLNFAPKSTLSARYIFSFKNVLKIKIYLHIWQIQSQMTIMQSATGVSKKLMIILFIYTCTHIFLFFFALFFHSEISNLFFCDDEMSLFAIVSIIKHQKFTYFYCFVHNLLIIIDIKFISHAHFSFVTLNGLCGYLMSLVS